MAGLALAEAGADLETGAASAEAGEASEEDGFAKNEHWSGVRFFMLMLTLTGLYCNI